MGRQRLLTGRVTGVVYGQAGQEKLMYWALRSISSKVKHIGHRYIAALETVQGRYCGTRYRGITLPLHFSHLLDWQ